MGLELVMKAIQKIKEINGTKKGISGDIDCPKCGRKLNYTIAASNGHIWGHCETNLCINFVQ